MSDTLMFAFCLLDTGALLFLLVYYVIVLSDLECDYLNAQQCCSNLNIWVIPRIIAHLIPAILLIFTQHWLIALCVLPGTIWLIYECCTVPKGNMGVYDPTEIYNRGQLRKHMFHCYFGLGYYLTMVFVYLYCMILAMLATDPRHKEEIINDLNP